MRTTHLVNISINLNLHNHYGSENIRRPIHSISLYDKPTLFTIKSHKYIKTRCKDQMILSKQNCELP